MKSNLQSLWPFDREINGVNSPPKVGRLRKHSGFATVEIVVGMAILSLSLSVLFRAIGEGLSNIARAEALVRADILARSLLTRVGVDIPVLDTDVVGVSTDGLKWRLLIQPYEPGTKTDAFVEIYRVVAQVRTIGDRAQSITLSTLRLAQKAAQ